MEMGTQNHPECKEGEVYLTCIYSRTHIDEYRQIGYQTKRLGKVVFDINGSIVEDLLPVFVSKQEWDENEKRLRKIGGFNYV